MTAKIWAALACALVLGACAGHEAAAPEPVVTAPAPVRIDGARIDAALKHFVDDGQVAGVSGLVFHNGREAYFGAFGMADGERHVPMARNTLVQIFSMTKPITGAALMQLYERDKFQLDDPLVKYFPEFANLKVYGGLDQNQAPIYVAPARAPTVRDITRHTAGFMPYAGDETPAGAAFVALDVLNLNNTLDEFVRRLGQAPLQYQPGTQWAYSPSVDVQAALVQRLSGEPYDHYLQAHIFGPLGMSDTHYVVPEQDRARMARPYRRADDGSLTPLSDQEAFNANTHNWALKPGGHGLVSSIDDYMRFARMLQNEGSLDGVQILRPETVRLMSTNQLDEAITQRMWLPSKGQVGFGIDFAVRLRPPANAQERSGAVGEFFWDGAASTLFWVDPANDVTAVLFLQEVPFDRIGIQKAFRDAIYHGSAAAAPEAQ